jgi:hypothetical protein
MWWGSSDSSCGGGYTGGVELALMQPGCCDFNFRTYGGPVFVPGGGGGAADCTHEWLANPAPRLNQGIPRHRLVCRDDDPACDFGPSGDRACTFHVAQCFNVVDPHLPCTPTDVAAVKLLGAGDATDVANRQALADGLVARGGVMRGHCTNSGARYDEICTVNSDCDATLGTGDGVCGRRFVGFTPPLTGRDVCTEFASITVPLKQNASGALSRGHKTLRIKAFPSATRPDTDSLTLICDPQP